MWHWKKPSRLGGGQNSVVGFLDLSVDTYVNISSLCISLNYEKRMDWKIHNKCTLLIKSSKNLPKIYLSTSNHLKQKMFLIVSTSESN